MDCERFEDAIMDELYGELDEVTSAAVRRHASSCAKCAERLASLKATRKVLATSFAPIPVPAGLEDRIFAAIEGARSQHTTHTTSANAAVLHAVAAGSADAPSSIDERASLRGRRGSGESRIPRFVSAAGRWAMRPQTAMAAVFLLMIGSSVVLMRGSSSPASAVVVTERGAPADNSEAVAAAPKTELSNTESAHGPEPFPLAATATAAPGSPPVATPMAAASVASASDSKEGKRDTRDRESAASGPLALNDDGLARRAPSRPAPPAAAAPAPIARAEPQAANQAPAAKKSLAESVVAAEAPAQAAAPVAGGGGQAQGGTFADAMNAYRAKRYADALRMFDTLAAQGDSNAALFAARSERQASGCASAVNRFDRLASSAFGTSVGYDATLEAGRCYRQLGSFDAARGRFARLLTVPSHAAAAQAELDAMNPVRAKAASPQQQRSTTGEGL